ncbi:hypothetical protein GCM10010493_78680 [Streptomyces lavendulae subsp. grasserius]
MDAVEGAGHVADLVPGARVEDAGVEFGGQFAALGQVPGDFREVDIGGFDGPEGAPSMPGCCPG